MASIFETLSAGDRMVWTCLSCLAFRRKQNQSLMLVSSRRDSPTVRPASEAEEMPDSRESQQVGPLSLTTLDSRESQETGPPSLATLPTELVLLISELLPVEDALCLALTCKRTHEIAHNYRIFGTRLDQVATETLLCRLERDTTRFTCCFIHEKLRPAQFLPKKPLTSYLHFHRTVNLERVPYFRISLFMLEYCTARIVTNHQLLGPRHGVPASYLASTHNYQPPWAEGICKNEVWAANVIYGELFLSCIRMISHKEANAGALQHFCNAHSGSIQICTHMDVGGFRGKGLPKDVVGNTKHQDSGWCQKCETDWEVDISWADMEHGWMVTVRTYHGLGACRSPQDQKWQAMSINPKGKAYREVPGGGVKEIWEQHKSQLC